MSRDDEARRHEDEVDALYRAGSPSPPDPAVVERLAANVFGRLETRRVRQRQVRRGATVAAAAAVLVAGVAVSVLFFSPPTEEVARPSPPPAAPTSPRPAPEKLLPSDVSELRLGLQSTDRRLALAAADSLLRRKARVAEEAVLEALVDQPESRGAEAILETLAGRPLTFARWLPRVFELETVSTRAFERLAGTRGREFELVLATALESSSSALHGLAVREVASRSPSRSARMFWRELRRHAARDTSEAQRDLKVYLSAALEGLPRPGLKRLVHDVRRSRPARGLRSARTLGADPSLRLSDGEFASALASSGRKEAWPLIEALLETRGPDPKLIRAAGRLGDPRVLPLLERWLYLGDGRGEAVVEALGKLPGERSLELLLAAHAVSRSGAGKLWPGFRSQLSRSLAARRDEATDMLVARCYQDPGRENAMESLADLFPEKAVAVLEDLLGTAPPRFRPRVARALAGLKTPEAIRVLVRALGDPALRRLARQSLRGVAASDLGPNPEAWRRWFHRFSAGSGEETSGAWPGPETRLLIAHHRNTLKEAL